jgi:SAM-dependent methyltransferase
VSRDGDRVRAANLACHALEAPVYDEIHPEATNAYQLRATLRRLDRIDRTLGPERRAALDLGAGTGFMSLELLRRGFSVTAVDFSNEMLSVFARKLARTGGDVRIVRSEVGTFLDDTTETFDLVTLSAFLHHLFDLRFVVRAAADHVRPGGMLFVNHEPLKGRIESLPRYLAHRALAAVDETVFRANVWRRGIRLSDYDYEMADYQRTLGGIDPDEVGAVLRESGLVDVVVHRYTVRRHGLAAWCADALLRTPNTFSLVARRPE